MLLGACCLFAAVPDAAAQVVLNPVPARVVGHPQIEPRTANPNLVEGRELFAPQGIALDTTASPPILYVADTANHRVLAWRDAASFGVAARADLVIGQRDLFSTLELGPGTNLTSGLRSPTGLAVDSTGNLYVADSGNNRIVRYRRPFEQQAEIVLADFVIGQPTLNSRTANTGGLSASSLSFQSGSNVLKAGLAIDAQGSLFVTDAGNHRVLRYPSHLLGEGAGNQPAADLVLGQPGFTTNTALPVTAQNRVNKAGMREPSSIAVDPGGRVYVAEQLNRVLVYRPALTSGMPAARIMGVVVVEQGQTPPPPINAASLGTQLGPPDGVFCIGNIPFVIDTGASRVLRYAPFDQWPAESPAAFSPFATAVIGQSTFDQNQPSDNRGLVEPSSNTFFRPRAGVGGAGMTFIADTANNRVLAFGDLSSGPSTTTGDAYRAQRVLGQIGFEYRSPNLIEGREVFFGGSGGTAVDTRSNPPRLYIADPGNHRVLAYADARGVRPGDRADMLIGQPRRDDFFRALINSPTNQQITPTQGGLFLPAAVAVDAEGNLWVADQGNGRVLRYPNPFAQGGAQILPDVVLGQLSFSSRTTDATSQTMTAPAGLAFTVEGALLVSDVSHNRILHFDPPFTNAKPASKVFGQPDFTSTGAGPEANRTNGPRHIAIDSDDRLYVADTGNNRVVIFPRVPAADTTNSTAVFVLSVGLNNPRSVAVSRQTGEIWVASTGNNQMRRYPRFDVLVTTGDQPNLTFSSNSPVAAALDGFNNLQVGDGLNRITLHFPVVYVCNGGSFLPRVAPGMWTTLSVDPAQGCRSTTSLNYSFTEETSIGNSVPLPKVLADLQVLINDEPAPVYYASPFQINFLMSNNAPQSGTVELQLVQASSGRVVASQQVAMSRSSPGFFTFGGGTGQIAALNQDNSVNGANNRIGRGEIIQLFATGAGFVPGAPPDGDVASGLINTQSLPRVIINNEFVPDSDITYSGLAPGLLGVWQLNVRVSDRVPPNENVLVIMLMNDIPSNNPQNPAQIRTTIAVR